MLGGRSEDSFSASKIGGLGWAAGRMVCVKFGAWAGYIQIYGFDQEFGWRAWTLGL